jgi:hypothetical protein
VRDRPQAGTGTAGEDQTFMIFPVSHKIPGALHGGPLASPAGHRSGGRSSDLERVDGCDLCEAARITPWFHEDDICWIAECEICAVPMVVWRGHGVSPPPEHLEHMHERLASVVTEHFEVRRTTSMTTCGISPTTITRTLGLKAVSSDTG